MIVAAVEDRAEPDVNEHSSDDDQSMGSDSSTKPELPKSAKVWLQQNAKKPQKGRNKRKDISPPHANIELSNPFVDPTKRVRNAT
jgi:hypothetical protein